MSALDHSCKWRPAPARCPELSMAVSVQDSSGAGVRLGLHARIRRLDRESGLLGVKRTGASAKWDAPNAWMSIHRKMNFVHIVPLLCSRVLSHPVAYTIRLHARSKRRRTLSLPCTRSFQRINPQMPARLSKSRSCGVAGCGTATYITGVRDPDQGDSAWGNVLQVLYQPV